MGRAKHYGLDGDCGSAIELIDLHFPELMRLLFVICSLVRHAYVCIASPSRDSAGQASSTVLYRRTIMKKKPQSWNRDLLVSPHVEVDQSVKSALPSRRGVSESFGWSNVTTPQRILSNHHGLLDVGVPERIRVDVFCSEWSG